MDLLVGRVVQFSDDRGYGFIACDGIGEDVFVHAEQVIDGPHHLAVGMLVSFRVLESAKGKRAFDVREVDESSLPEPARVASVAVAAGNAPARPRPPVPAPPFVAPRLPVNPARPAPSTRADVDDDDDEDEIDVVSEATYQAEITDALISSCPEITATEIVAVRKRLLDLARRRGWVE